LHNQQTIMTHAHLKERRTPDRLSVRFNLKNPDHHLWKNNGTWWCHFTVHRGDFTKYRIRASLRTSNVVEARRRRDQLFLGSARASRPASGASPDAYGRSSK
jgi:hypothetical protein